MVDRARHAAEREGEAGGKTHPVPAAALTLLIVDEIGYLPFAQSGGGNCCSSWSARATSAAPMILTTNRGFAEWREVFGEPTIS